MVVVYYSNALDEARQTNNARRGYIKHGKRCFILKFEGVQRQA